MKIQKQKDMVLQNVAIKDPVIQMVKIPVENLSKGKTYYFENKNRVYEAKLTSTKGVNLCFSTEIDGVGILMLPGKIGKSYTKDSDLLPDFFDSIEDIIEQRQNITKQNSEDVKKWLALNKKELDTLASQMKTEFKNKSKKYKVPKEEWDNITMNIQVILQSEADGYKCYELIDDILSNPEEKYLNRAKFTTTRNFSAEPCVSKIYLSEGRDIKFFDVKPADKKKTPDYELDSGYADTFCVNSLDAPDYKTIINKVKEKANKYLSSKHQPFTAIINFAPVDKLLKDDVNEIKKLIKATLLDKKYSDTKVEAVIKGKIENMLS